MNELISQKKRGRYGLLHFTLQNYYKNTSISLKIVRALWIFVQFAQLNVFGFFGDKFNYLICILHLPLR